jgi:hypothetical protein
LDPLFGDPFVGPRRAVGSAVSSDPSAESPQSLAPGDAMGEDAQQMDMMMGYHIYIYLCIVMYIHIYIYQVYIHIYLIYIYIYVLYVFNGIHNGTYIYIYVDRCGGI